MRRGRASAIEHQCTNPILNASFFAIVTIRRNSTKVATILAAHHSTIFKRFKTNFAPLDALFHYGASQTMTLKLGKRTNALAVLENKVMSRSFPTTGDETGNSREANVRWNPLSDPMQNLMASLLRLNLITSKGLGSLILSRQPLKTRASILRGRAKP